MPFAQVYSPFVRGVLRESSAFETFVQVNYHFAPSIQDFIVMYCENV